jgi:hypothetical protein
MNHLDPPDFKGIGDQGTMTPPGQSLCAHQCNLPALCKLDQLT